MENDQRERAAQMGKSPSMNMHQHGYLLKRQQTEQDVYMLESNELLTANELFQGLAKIGIEYGRSASHQANVRMMYNMPSKYATSQNSLKQPKHSSKSGRPLSKGDLYCK